MALVKGKVRGAKSTALKLKYFSKNFRACRKFNNVVYFSNFCVLRGINLTLNKHKNIRVYQNIVLFQFLRRYVMLNSLKKEYAY